MAPPSNFWSKDNKSYTLFGMNLPMEQQSNRPRVLLFDIGGVCVVSPFQAIIDYEKAHSIPAGYINWAISQVGRTGAWARLERGEIPLNHIFFDAWRVDLSDEQRWRTYYARHLEQTNSTRQIPPVPYIDTQWLHTELMRIARALDPHMGPALTKLRRAADQSNGKLVLAALSNTCIFPRDHPLYDPSTVDGKASRGLGDIFEIFISSAHVGMRKPDEEIYRYTLVRLHEYVKTKGFGDGVKPEDITFLDDIGQNLSTARRLGMNTIKVKLGRADLAVAELEKLTGLQLTEDGGRPKL